MNKQTMLFHIKLSALVASNNDEFLFETKSSTKVDDLIEDIVAVHNARQRSFLIIDSVRGISTYGLMKQPNSVEETSGIVLDPSGLRTGIPPNEKMTTILQQAATALEDYVGKGKNQVDKKVALNLREIREKINYVRDAVALAYPMGLPEWELTRMALEDPHNDKLNLESIFANASNASLWVFNKELVRGQLVSDSVGTNEKTKVICKLTLKESGPPPREAIISESERNAMAAFYFKRQEELKRIADADEDDYLNSEWADPKGMKRNLQGLRDVRAPGLRF
jgi:hypothetical protein